MWQCSECAEAFSGSQCANCGHVKCDECVKR